MLALSVIGTLSLAAVGYTVVRVRRLRSAAVRDDAARARFVSHFVARGAPEPMLVQAFAVLRARRPDADGELRPDASLARDFGLTRLDLSDAALLIATRSAGRVPDAEDLDRLDQSVTSVGELVDFLTPFCRARAA